MLVEMPVVFPDDMDLGHRNHRLTEAQSGSKHAGE